MIRKYIIFFLTAEILSSGILLSQPVLEWEKVYPDTNTFNAYSYDLALDDSGNIYTTGLVEIDNIPSYCTIKYNPDGSRQWVALYTEGARIPCSIATDKLSNVFVTGYCYRSGTIFDFCTIKYNLNGEQQWVRFYDGLFHSYDQARKVTVDNAGNVYVSGFSTINGFDSRIYVTIKYSSEGNMVWLRAYGIGNIGTDITAMQIDNNCNIYITGGCDANAVTIKYDSSGNQKWVNTYSNGGDHSLATSLALDNNNDVIITGYTQFYSNRRAYFTVKYTSTGIQQWVRAVEPGTAMNSYYQSNSVVTDNTGYIYISGNYQNNNTEPGRMFMRKYSSEGDSVWYQTDIEDTLAPQLTYMDIDKNNNIYITGKLWTQPVTQILLTKYDSSGILKWKIATNYSNTNSEPNAMKVDANDNVFITGSKDPLGSIRPQMLTLKYSQLTGIINNEKNIISNYKLYQNYPNPFNSKTKINYELLTECHVKLLVFDITGKKITVFINKNQKAGKYQVDFDGTNYSSGIYFFCLSNNVSLIETKKMLLIK